MKLYFFILEKGKLITLFEGMVLNMNYIANLPNKIFLLEKSIKIQKFWQESKIDSENIINTSEE